jgi:predicted enzyme related to lactoylglutathione lyase
MKTGLVIYASSVGQLVEFYTQVFGYEVIESDNTYALLNEGDAELVLLETEVSKNVKNTYKPRETTPLKPVFFTDSSLSDISKKIKENGGSVYPPKNWDFGGRQVCDAHDCEGNIFQLRVK